MAATYTYDDFLKYAEENGQDVSTWHDYDLDIAKSNPSAGITLVDQFNDYKNATTDEQKKLAHYNVDTTRREIGGFTTDLDGTNPINTDGSAYMSNDQIKALAEAWAEGYNSSSSSSPTYNNQYSTTEQALLSKILGSSYSYDPETDTYAQYLKEQYTNNGKNAMEDTLAQVSARTGGLASSYAGTAAQQTYNDYMSALNSALADREETMYNRYQTELSNLYNQLSAVSSLEQNDYSKYLNELSEYDTKTQNSQSTASSTLSSLINAGLASSITPQLAAAAGVDYDTAVALANSAAGETTKSNTSSMIGSLITSGNLSGITDEQLEAAGYDPTLARALAAEYAKQSTSTGTKTTSTTKIDSSVVKQLEAAYPDGVITSKDDWDWLVEEYGESALKAAGYSFQQDYTVDDYKAMAKEYLDAGNDSVSVLSRFNAMKKDKVISEDEYKEIVKYVVAYNKTLKE